MSTDQPGSLLLVPARRSFFATAKRLLIPIIGRGIRRTISRTFGNQMPAIGLTLQRVGTLASAMRLLGLNWMWRQQATTSFVSPAPSLILLFTIPIMAMPAAPSNRLTAV